MKLVFNILTFLLLLNNCFSQQVYERKINWSIKSNITDSYEKKYLWFDNAVYLDHESMIPSHFELIKIDESISNYKNYSVTIENDIWGPINDAEYIAVDASAISVGNQNIVYSIAKEAGKKFVQISTPTIRLNRENRLEKLISFRVNIYPVASTNGSSVKLLKNPTKSSSVLSSGKWIKVFIENSGIHKITYSELQSFGLGNLSNVSIWGNGGKKLAFMNNQTSPDDLNPIPIYIEKGNDGIFNQGDYILFFAEGPKYPVYNPSVDMWTEEQHPYTKKTHYFITTDHTQTLIQTETQPLDANNYTSNSYDAIITFEQNDTNLVKSGREWFGDIFDLTTTRNYNTNLSNPEVGSELKVWLRAAARSAASSNYTVKVNSVNIGTLSLNGVIIGDELADLVSVKSQVFKTTIPNNNLTIELSYNKTIAASTGWLDFLTINARQRLVYNGSQLIYRDLLSTGTGRVTQFTIQTNSQNVQIWDVSNINQAKKIETTINAGSLSFKCSTESLRQFIAFEPSNTRSVSFVGEVANQNLHGLNQPDMVIVTHPTFLSHANELASIHRELDELNVVVLTNEQVYNEFSSGNPDVSSIRNLMRMLYQRANAENEFPRYLLLFGDGSYDNLSTKSSNTNYILTFQSERSINKIQSFITDDYFGLLDENEGEADGLLDIGIGRIPAKSTQEADVVIGKIKQYISSDNIGGWQNQLLFIGDDEDGNIHMQDANTLADYISINHNEYNIQKVFFDAYKQENSSGGASYPDATSAINTTINNGALLVNYTGHGNERWLSHEKVIMLDDVLSWKNYKSLSLFVTATCEFSRFDDYNLTSTGEWVLLSPKGAGIALLSTTRLVYSNPNFVLNYNFIKNIFAKSGVDNTYNTLGDLVRVTKNISGTGYNKRNFTLLGDPALKLRYPKYKIDLLSLNGKLLTEQTDTLKALSEVSINGQVLDFNGNLASNFTGLATITVFDKAKNITTLTNDGGYPMTFSSRENVIYKGNAAVEGGLFELDFIVPKDINYQYGSGRISLFATNNDETAMGSNESIIVGGISNFPAEDVTGPEIKIYLNDENFKNGGISDPNPKLLVKLFDESGINTTGIGIGHDLTATLSSDDLVQKFNLNNYYQSDVNDFKRGRVEFQLTNLSPGLKKMRVKAWDIYNNSSETEISFNVTSGNKLEIKNFYGFPNPFSDKTDMFFEHNQPDTDLDIEIQIFNYSGMLVKQIFYSEQNSGNYRIGPISWNGLNNTGSPLGRGIYICRLIVKSANGDTAQIQNKLVIMK